jgi:hypothetical protein
MKPFIAFALFLSVVTNLVLGTLLFYNLEGDMNGDKQVDIVDLSILAAQIDAQNK